MTTERLPQTIQRAVYWTCLFAIAALGTRLASAQQGEGSPLPPGAGVVRALFTSNVVNNEPVDQVVTLKNSVTEIYYYTELQNLGGRTLTYQWEYEGQVVSRVSFEVGGPSWIAHAKHKLDPSLIGKWTVILLDESGWALHASIFRYEDVSAP